MRPSRALLVAVAVATSITAAPGARADANCATPDPASGEWRSYGHDLANTRSQPLEQSISPSNVMTLGPAWAKSTADFDADGGYSSTPVVVDGCVFIGTDSGWVLALNADTGDRVWGKKLPLTPTPLGGVVVGSPTVDNGLVIVLASVQGGPLAVAYDETTGAEKWRTVIDTLPTSYINASPTVWNGLVFAGFTGDEYTADARGGYVVLDESTGALLHKEYTISNADYALGYRGASIWATAVVDPNTGFAYVGTGNPGGTSRTAKRHWNTRTRMQSFASI